MELIYRLTREQLEALAPCPEGLDLFDRLSTGGVIESTSAEQLIALAKKIPNAFKKWLGPLLISGSGDGYGDGY